MTIFSLQIQSTYMFMRWSNNTVYYTDVFQISIFVFGQNKKLVWTIYYSKDFLSETLLSKNNQGTRSIPSDFFGEKGTRLIKSDFFGEKEGFQQQLFHVDYPLPLSCSLMIKQKHVKITQWNTMTKCFFSANLEHPVKLGDRNIWLSIDLLIRALSYFRLHSKLF